MVSATTAAPEERFTWTVDSSVPKTAAAEAAIDAAAPIYVGFMTTVDESIRAPSSQDWGAELKKYASGQTLTDLTSSWQSYRTAGGHRLGTTSSKARIVAAGKNGVSYRACMDFSKIEEVDKSGQPMSLPTGWPSKGFAWLLTVQDGVVTSMVGALPSGKPIPC